MVLKTSALDFALGYGNSLFMAKLWQQAESLPLLQTPPLQKNSFSLEPMHTSCAVSMRSVMKKKKKKVIYVLILIKVISEVPNQKAVEGDQSFYPILFV